MSPIYSVRACRSRQHPELVLSRMGPQIQWVHREVTGDRAYCIHSAPDEAAVREHAKLGGSSAKSAAEVVTIIEPTTAE